MQAFRLLLAFVGMAALVVAIAPNAIARTVTGQVLGQDGKPIPNAVVFVQEPATLQTAASSSPAIMDQ